MPGGSRRRHKLFSRDCTSNQCSQAAIVAAAKGGQAVEQNDECGDRGNIRCGMEARSSGVTAITPPRAQP